jgi:hypothetical protein
MDTLSRTLLATLVTGLVATAITDVWMYARKPLLGVAAPNYGMVGRWIAHMRHGQFHHASIANAPAVPGELLLGWTAHYLIGIVFAALLVSLAGKDWLREPALMPALIVGIVTVLAPFLIMQPGMGAGIRAGSRSQSLPASETKSAAKTMPIR